MLPATSPIKLLKTRGLFSAAVLIALGGLAVCRPAVAGEAAPAPLPPPPELLDGVTYNIGEPFYDVSGAGQISEETKQALTPPTIVTAQPVPQPPVAAAPATASVPRVVIPASAPAPVPVAAAPARPPVSTMQISPPSRFMPVDYYNLPMDEEGVPGVLLPELNENFADPGYATRSSSLAARRPATAGMSIRQLEPFFALAKGTEGEALEAKQRGDEAVYQDQIAKSIAAYMEIINMADAGNEAREEAWYGVARCEYRRGNWWKAFDALERSFPKKFERSEVAGRIKLEMFVGERLWGMGTQPVPGTMVDGSPLNGYQAASRVYAAAIFNQPTAKDAPLALLRRGDAAAMDKDWKEAAKFYRQVVEYYPESDQAMQARSSLTEAIYRQDWPTGFPEAGREDVASIMDDVERAKPASLSPEAEERRQRAVTIANNLEAETKLRHAKEYLKSMRVKKSRDAAVFLLGDVVSHYPNTPQAGEASDILRGMGIEPPMVLSDGSRFPITRGWSGADAGADAEQTGIRGGSVTLEGQDDIRGSILPPSPTRETVYERLPDPTPATTP